MKASFILRSSAEAYIREQESRGWKCTLTHDGEMWVVYSLRSEPLHKVLADQQWAGEQYANQPGEPGELVGDSPFLKY